MKPLNRVDRKLRCAVPALMTVLFAAPVAADPEADVAALEAKCEEAREAKLKPLREAEIAKCKASERNDPAYCARYWSDYGNAMRLQNGAFRPRLFDDLPECVAAYAARRKLNLEGK